MAQFAAAVIDPDLNLGHRQTEYLEPAGRCQPVVLFLACWFAWQQGAGGWMVGQVFAALQRGLQHRASHGPECCVGCGWLVVEQRDGHLGADDAGKRHRSNCDEVLATHGHGS